MAKSNWLLALVALATTVVVSLFGKGMLRLIPIFSGIVVGYGLAIALGMIDFQPVVDAPWFALPAFIRPEFSWEAIIFMVPVAIAPVIEHIGDVCVFLFILFRKLLSEFTFSNTGNTSYKQ